MIWFQPVIVKLWFNLKEQGEDGGRGYPWKGECSSRVYFTIATSDDSLILKGLAFRPELIPVMDKEWLKETNLVPNP